MFGSLSHFKGGEASFKRYSPSWISTAAPWKDELSKKSCLKKREEKKNKDPSGSVALA